MRLVLFSLLVAILFALHQDLWFWRTPHPIVFGILPIGLAYHALYSIVIAGLMLLLVRYAWPAWLEDER
jgi:hypothetical protein